MFDALFQLHSDGLVEFESGFAKHGPFSSSNAYIDEDPGPPFNHIVSGALLGSSRASKNQKN